MGSHRLSRTRQSPRASKTKPRRAANARASPASSKPSCAARHAGGTVGRNAPLAPYNQGRTGTHEVGHYLGLYHTFQNGCGGSNCYASGDRICDTNAESQPEYNCPNNSSSCGSTDPVRNYMNYSTDTCMNNFTDCLLYTSDAADE